MNKLYTAISFVVLCGSAFAADYRTDNFKVAAPSPQWAKAIGDAAEQYRVEMAKLWLNQTMPKWSVPCEIKASVEDKNYGSTSFVFNGGEVFGWYMSIHGTPARLIDSVLRHEIVHTVFASHFRQPLPRWADEGACTTVEHPDEVENLERSCIQCLKTGRGIPFDRMLQQMNYGSDFMAVYGQGHSVASWLIEKYGRPKFVAFLDDGLKDKDWSRAVRVQYGYGSPLDMQKDWNAWVKVGRPNLQVVGKHCEIRLDQYGRPVKVCVPDQWDQQPQGQPNYGDPNAGNPTTFVQPTNPPAITPPKVGDQNQPPPPTRSCDCPEKWAAFDKWKTEITATLTAQATTNKNNAEQLVKVNQALSSLTNETANITKIDQRVTNIESTPVKNPPTIDEILTELDKRRVLPRIRIVDPQGKFTTQYAEVRDGKDIDLLIDNRFTPAQTTP